MQSLVMKRGEFTQVPILYTTDKIKQRNQGLIDFCFFFLYFFTPYYYICGPAMMYSTGMFQAIQIAYKIFLYLQFFFHKD